MAQEWILQSMTENFDVYEDENELGEMVKMREYKFSLVRYAKYVPPLTLNLLELDFIHAPSAVKVSACGQEVSAVDLITYRGEVIQPDALRIRLRERSLHYSTGESGVLMVSELWELDSIEPEFLDAGNVSEETYYDTINWRPISDVSNIA